MILYLDTSALVKLYVAEVGTETVAAGVERAAALVTPYSCRPPSTSGSAAPPMSCLLRSTTD